MKFSRLFLFAATFAVGLPSFSAIAQAQAQEQPQKTLPTRRTISRPANTTGQNVPATRFGQNLNAPATAANDTPIAVNFIDAKPPAGTQTGTSAGTPAEAKKLIDRLVIVDSPAPQVFDLLERLTGKSVIRSQTLPVLRINFDSRGPIAIDKAIIALESLLALNGVSILPEGDDFLKAVLSGYATSEAPPLYMDSVADLPASERSIARLFRFQNINVASVEQLLRGMVTSHRGGSLLSLPAANSILVTDSLTNVQRLERLIGNIDVPGQVLFYNLKNIKASEVVKQLQTLQQAGMKNMLQGDVGFSANDAANQLIIVTSAANKGVIDGLIAQFDVENVPLTRSEVFALKYADADSVAAALKGVIEGSRQNSATGQNKAAAVTIIGNGASGTRASSSAGRSSSGTSGTSSRVSSGTSARTFSAENSGNDGNASSDYEVISTARQNRDGDGVPASGAETDTQRFSDYLTIIGDTRANSIVAIGTNSDISQIRDIVKKIDVSLPQVRIEAIVVEVVLEEGDISGLNTLGLGYRLTPSSTSATLDGNYRITTAAPGSAFSLNASIKDLAFEMVFNQAKTNNKVKILSSPTIMTMHNQPAQIVIGESRPFITGSTTDSTSLNTSSQVQYKDVGLDLQVTPRIGADGSVQMDVTQKMENLIGVTTIDGNEQPIISTRKAVSYISAENHETVVLAGLQSFEEKDNKGKVFILGDIPLLGWFFRPKNYGSTKRELIIFLRPHVMNGASDEPLLGTHNEALTREDAKDFVEKGRFRQLESDASKKRKEEDTKRREAEAEARAAVEKAEAEARAEAAEKDAKE